MLLGPALLFVVWLGVGGQRRTYVPRAAVPDDDGPARGTLGASLLGGGAAG